MLQRHVEILDRLRLFSENVEKRIADVRWIGVHHAHPLDTFSMRKLAQQMRQRILLAEVLAIARRVLRDQNQFLYAFFGKLMSFSDDRSKATAAKVSPHLRNETERAGSIATFGDLDERV